ncbi:MAG: hypothetical protein HY870_15140 [Chloroflexi bacterium]|nr:hypothetical protein [Chloroflexota bacterium]
MIRRNAVTRTEWRWVFVWIVIALIISSIPYAIGALRSTSDHVFGGFVIAIEDGNSYLAKMNEGAHGAWLFHLPYTSEPHTGTLIYIHYLLLGKIAAVFGLPLSVVFHLARLIFATLYLLVLYRFIARFAVARAARRIAFLLVVFSGGLGWLLILMGQPNWLGSAPLDLISPEAFTFLTIYAFPHISLARMCLLLGFMALWSDHSRPIWAGLCWFVMGVLVPLDVGVVYAILAASVIAVSIDRRRLAGDVLRRSIIPVIMIAPIIGYSFMLFTFDPILTEWYTQGIMLSPPPLHFVVGYLLVGVLAIIGLKKNPNSEARNPKLVAWFVIGPVLAYAPFSFQRRLIEGWQISLSIFAAMGLVYRVLPAWRRSRVVRRLATHRRYSARGLRQWALAAVLLLLFATYALLLSEQSMRMLAQLPPSFRDGGEIAALRWLDAQVQPDAVILASYATSNFAPTIVAARMFTGHGPETAYSDRKRELVAAFYAAATPDEARQAFLRDWSITYVIYGPLEKQLGQVDLSGLDNLDLVYDRNGYQIYRIKR